MLEGTEDELYEARETTMLDEGESSNQPVPPNEPELDGEEDDMSAGREADHSHADDPQGAA